MSVPRAVQQVPCAAGDLAEHAARSSSKSAPLAADRARSAPRAAAAASIATRRSSRPLKPAVDLLAELVHRGVEPGRVQQVGQLGRVAVEVALQHAADAPDGAVALGLVEQLVHHGAQGAAIAQELLQRAWQAAVAIGEVGAERLLQRLGSPLVDLLGLADHALELRAHGIHVDGHAGVLERDEPDAQGPFDERTPILRRALPQERGEGRVRQGRGGR